LAERAKTRENSAANAQTRADQITVASTKRITRKAP
jgi:hypothetical protein